MSDTTLTTAERLDDGQAMRGTCEECYHFESRHNVAGTCTHSTRREDDGDPRRVKVYERCELFKPANPDCVQCADCYNLRAGDTVRLCLASRSHVSKSIDGCDKFTPHRQRLAKERAEFDALPDEADKPVPEGDDNNGDRDG